MTGCACAVRSGRLCGGCSHLAVSSQPHDGLIRRGAVTRVQGHGTVHGAVVGDAARVGERVRAWKRTRPPRSFPAVQAAAPAPPAPCVPASPGRTPPGLTSVRQSLSCRCTLGGSREAGAQAVQIPPSPAWSAGEGLGARTRSPEAPGGPRRSAQGPAAGKQALSKPRFWGHRCLAPERLSTCFRGRPLSQNQLL